MNRTMLTATNTLSQLQKKMDIISNNMSNIDTTGFKRKETYFNDLLAQEFKNQGRDDKEKGRLTPIGIRIGTGAKISQSRMVLSQGSLKTTDRNLDLALKKSDQFFKIRGDQNTIQYTRDGAFYLSPADASGTAMALVNGNGQAVLDESDRPIVINGDISNLSFTENGQLRASTENGGVQTFELGIISVKKPQFFEQKGTNLYALPERLNTLEVTEDDVFTRLDTGLRGNISMQQGVLENSNVELSKEMTDLMNVQRSYQFQARTITMADQMAGLVNGIR
ncbi:flagellar hook-basal body protein [Peribacillus deserti]|uniref:Flagellar biosynthesis protein FlgG n=1 Tax=Peribacillus deserti TaxID=673318 RepID=A0A2N5MBN9_9BACI|nr:flagellar hook-basal body protein [Peribacillus deserti]PLT31725.1 flagellar biosynthesis protein FlgG [Peribacillus deserti]